jgi:Uma2 family endonuclease
MSVTHQLVTADELLHIPDDGFRYELVQGELRKMAPAGHEHGSTTINITLPLGQYVRDHELGKVYAAETGFKLATDPDTVRAPDVAFVSSERVEAAADVKGYWPGAPDLAVEVISPGDLYTEVDEKVTDWLNAGTRMVIVVNPRKRSVTVYHSASDIKILNENDTLEGGDVVPGWAMPVREIFI